MGVGIDVQQTLMWAENFVKAEGIAVYAKRLEIGNVVRRIGYRIDKHARIAGSLDSTGDFFYRIGGAYDI